MSNLLKLPDGIALILRTCDQNLTGVRRFSVAGGRPRRRTRLGSRAGAIGEEGLEAGTPYRLDANGNFVKAVK